MAVTPGGRDSFINVDIVLGVHVKGSPLILIIRHFKVTLLSHLYHPHLGLEGRVVVALGDDAGLDADLLQLVAPGQGPGQGRGRIVAGARRPAGPTHHDVQAVPGAPRLLLRDRQLGKTWRPGKAGNLENIQKLFYFRHSWRKYPTSGMMDSFLTGEWRLFVPESPGAGLGT